MCTPAIVPIAAATGLVASQRKKRNRPTATATISKPTIANKVLQKTTPKPVAKDTPKPVVKATPKPAPVTKPTPTPVAKAPTPTPEAAPATRQTATTMAKAPLEQAAAPEQKKRRFTKTRGLIGGRRRGTSSLRIASRGTSNLNY